MTDDERIALLIALRGAHLHAAAWCALSISTITARRSFDRFLMAYQASEMQDSREMDNRLVDWVK